MNQTQTDRDTSTHMLKHSVNFTISLTLSPSLSFFLTHLSLLRLYKLTFPAFNGSSYHDVFPDFLDYQRVRRVSRVPCHL